jgi:PhnB protein
MSSKIPEGYHSIQPYLMFTDCSKAIAFYTQVFGGKEKLRMQDDKGRINHAELQMGDSVIMMAEEHPEIEAFAVAHYGGSPISIMLYVENCDATYQAAVAAGSKSLREPTDQPYGDRMAGVLDPFGYKWWIAHSLAKQDAKEAQS